jgi:hypothetical protein
MMKPSQLGAPFIEQQEPSELRAALLTPRSRTITNIEVVLHKSILDDYKKTNYSNDQSSIDDDTVPATLYHTEYIGKCLQFSQTYFKFNCIITPLLYSH